MSWEIDPNENYKPPAITKHVANFKIIDAEEKTTQAGGIMISVTLKLVSGPFKDRQMRMTYNVVNANEQAQGMAKVELQKLWLGIGGEGVLKNCSPLKGKTGTAELGEQKPGSDFNKIFSFPDDEDKDTGEYDNADPSEGSIDDDIPF